MRIFLRMNGNKIKKICFVNAHWSNHGDEAAIKAIIREIWKVNPNLKIKLLIKDKKKIEKSIFVDGKIIEHESNQFLPNQIDYFLQILTNGRLGSNELMKRCIECMREADYIIYAPGGSVINDRFWWRKQLEYMLSFIYSKLYKKPFYVASPSVGPFNEKLTIKNAIRKYIFNKQDYLFVREEQSEQYLKKIGANKKVIVTIDSAFCDELDLASQQKVLDGDSKLVEFLQEYEKIVGMTITELNWNVKYKEHPELADTIRVETKKFIERLKQENIGVVLIPQLFGNQNDSELLENYQNENTFLLNENYDSDFQQYLISKLYMIIGFRYHSNIFAAKNCVPFLSIIYEEKMESFLKSCGLDVYSIKVEEVTSERLWYMFKKIEANMKKYKDYLDNLTEEWRVKTKIIKNSIADFLEDSSC